MHGKGSFFLLVSRGAAGKAARRCSEAQKVSAHSAAETSMGPAARTVSAVFRPLASAACFVLHSTIFACS